MDLDIKLRIMKIENQIKENEKMLKEILEILKKSIDKNN